MGDVLDSAIGSAATGRFVDRGGRRFYEIDAVDQLPAFLMTIVGDTDLWLYLSSAGGLTAGRTSPERCLFPYETDDRLHAAAGVTGPVTLVRLPDQSIWRPMDTRALERGRERRLLRTPIGDAVVFEEFDPETGITFRSEWTLCDEHGVVRRYSLDLAPDAGACEVEVLDGLLNVMPACVYPPTQREASTLIDAYKRCEIDPRSGIAVYTLEAAISDRPEARECLRANVVWSAGLDAARVALAGDAVARFERGLPIDDRSLSTGRRGAYLLRSTVWLAPGSAERWMMVGDVDLDHGAVAARRRWLGSTPDRAAAIERCLGAGRDRLDALLDQADGSQMSGDESAMAAHRSNVLFNAMRGGVPVDGYTIEIRDFRRHLHRRHRDVAGRHDGFLALLGERVSLDELKDAAASRGDLQLVRLVLEYLPLTFGRRHGDPSRPWNQFRIRMRDSSGRRSLGYEGNWRDIFQNWEAMCRSYPAYLPSVIAKFVNASTPDGHNPYRIDENGIDWEVPDPSDPWSNIGYWGDHQLVYLLRLLEQLWDADPAALLRMLDQPMFSYADVPYAIKPFDELVGDPKQSIHFDREHHEELVDRSARVGEDGRLVWDDHDEPRLVCLGEKLLVTILSKVSNLVPGGGVWMNTQRPEWNDANNALAGHGLSMVTLCQLRSFTDFGLRLFNEREGDTIPVSETVVRWCEDILAVLINALELIDSGGVVDDAARWTIMRSLGERASRVRVALRERGLGDARRYQVRAITDLFRVTRYVCDHSIRLALRDEGLYDSYSVLHIDAEAGRASVERLDPMLEGQVAVLSTGLLTGEESVRLIDTLFASELYREDQRTFILYPRRDLPSFMDRNVIPDELIDASPLLSAVIEHPLAPLVRRDDEGRARFAPDLVGRAGLERCLAALAEDPEWADLIRDDADSARSAFEAVFRHTRFTGRSGTMHKYEGIGSVYWHMVSKLLLASQDAFLREVDRQSNESVRSRLADAYRRVRAGLGLRKTPQEFGAVPHEPYSHTPWGAGAQQPGMTGQVKEGVLARLGELGVRLREGEIRFEPHLLDASELLTGGVSWRPRAVGGHQLAIPGGAIGFCVCGTPVVLEPGDAPEIRVHTAHGETVTIAGASLGRSWSKEVFSRTGRVRSIEVRSPLIGSRSASRPRR